MLKPRTDNQRKGFIKLKPTLCMNSKPSHKIISRFGKERYCAEFVETGRQKIDGNEEPKKNIWYVQGANNKRSEGDKRFQRLDHIKWMDDERGPREKWIERS